MILSIQSDVLHGHVGQKAALPIYQASSIEATQLATVTLAAHPGFGVRHRSILPADVMAGLLEDFLTLAERPELTALHVGYFGAADQIEVMADFIHKARQLQPEITIMLDPVFGEGERRYVADEIIEAVIEKLVPIADIITPNHFELSLLYGQAINSKQTALSALQTITGKQGQIKCLTGLYVQDDEMIYDIICQDEISAETAHRALPQGVSGAGDAFAALLLSSLQKGHTLKEALFIASRITSHMIAQSKSPLTLNVASGLVMIDGY